MIARGLAARSSAGTVIWPNPAVLVPVDHGFVAIATFMLAVTERDQVNCRCTV